MGDAPPTMLERGLAVLGAFDRDHVRLSLTEIASRTGLPLTTTHRLVGQLLGWGALVAQPDRRYAIGPRIWDLGLLSPLQRELRTTAAPFLRDVFATTRRNVHLAVADGTTTLFVERISEPRTAPLVSTAGSRLPLHVTAVGKALLAHTDPERVGALVDAVLADPVAPTPNTVVDREVLLAQLGDVRASGFARTVEEYSRGARGIGVPVLGADGRAVAAIGVVATSTSDDIERLVPVLQVAARALARRLDPRADAAYDARRGFHAAEARPARRPGSA